MSRMPNHRDFFDGQPIPRCTKDYVVATGAHKGWTVQLVSDQRSGLDVEVLGQKTGIKVSGYIAGVAMRPPLWWAFGLFGRTHIGPLPLYMQPYKPGDTFAVTEHAQTLQQWQKNFEAFNGKLRRPRVLMPGFAARLLGG